MKTKTTKILHSHCQTGFLEIYRNPKIQFDNKHQILIPLYCRHCRINVMVTFQQFCETIGIFAEE